MRKENEIEILPKYLQEIGVFGELLTKEEELILARKIQNGLNMPNGEVEYKVGRDVISTMDSYEAFKTLVSNNLKLVVSIAKKKYFEVPLEDRIQYGNEGLMIGAVKFKPEKGNCFSTYATWWIRQAIFHGVTNNESVVKIPKEEKTKMYKLKRVSEEFEKKLGRKPTLSELALSAGYQEKSVIESLKISNPIIIELDSVYHENNSQEKVEYLLIDQDNIDEKIDEQILVNEVKIAVDTLKKPLEKEIITLKYGLKDGIIRSAAEIDRILGLGRNNSLNKEKALFKKLNTSSTWSQVKLLLK